MIADVSDDSIACIIALIFAQTRLLLFFWTCTNQIATTEQLNLWSVSIDLPILLSFNLRRYILDPL